MTTITNDVAVTYSDGQTVHNVVGAAVAFAMFASYQREVDHPEASAAVRGSVVPVRVVMQNPSDDQFPHQREVPMATWTDTERDTRWTNMDKTLAELVRDVRLHAMLERGRNGGLAANELWNILESVADEQLRYVLDPDMDTDEAIAATETYIRERF